MTGDHEFTASIASDYRGAILTAADRQMLDYVAKLTRTPGDMTENDLRQLRAGGFSDRAILDIA